MSRIQISQLDTFIDSNISALPSWAIDNECIYIIEVVDSIGSKIIKIGQAPKGMIARRTGLRSWLISHDLFEITILGIIQPNDALMRSEKYIHTELSKLCMNVNLKDHFETKGSQETYKHCLTVLTRVCELIKKTSRQYWTNDFMKHFIHSDI